MKHAITVLLLGITAFIISPSLAQEAAVDSVSHATERQAYRDASATADTLQEYNLAEIVVLSGEDLITSPSTVQRVSLAAIARQDARSSAEFARLIPAAHVQTNSRGETLVHVRNAGERQVAFYFDGALLNVPWDNRVDLGLVPASVVGGMTISKGVPSVVCGVNAVAGAVNLTSRGLDESGTYAEMYVQGGQPEMGQVSGTLMRRSGNLRLAASAGVSSERGLPLPGDAALRFNQVEDDIRTNTDRRIANVFVRGEYRLRETAAISMALLHISSEKGVAPESHLDPAVGRVRYWRYPDVRNTMLIANGRSSIGNGHVRATLWGSHIRQDIEQYEDISFDRIETTEENRDLVAGSRIVVELPVASGRGRLAANWMSSEHVLQTHTELENATIAAPRLRFLQHTVSVGAEYSWEPLSGVEVQVGAGLDGASTPLTGDKPHLDPFVDYSATAGMVVDLTDGSRLRVAGGRKARFPTMRELFGEALNRFVLNPDLETEKTYTVEGGWMASGPRFSTEAAVFFSRSRDAIDQLSLIDGRRMRVNLQGSRTYGLEAVGRYRGPSGWLVEGHATWLNTRGLHEGERRPLAERPQVIGTGGIGYDLLAGLSLFIQAAYTGRAYSVDQDGVYVPLPTSLVVDTRLSYRMFVSRAAGVFAELFIRVDNLTDEIVMPQLGLPGPGRQISAGASFSL